MDHDADHHYRALALALAASSARAPTVVGRSEHHLGSDPMVGSVGMFGVPGYGDRL